MKIVSSYARTQCFLLSVSIACLFGDIAPGEEPNDYASLRREAVERLERLKTLTTRAKVSGIDTARERVTVVTAEQFLKFADYLASGGRLLLVGDDNFSQDQYGRPHKNPLKIGNRSVEKVAENDTAQLLSVVNDFLNQADLQNPIVVKEESANGAPGCVWRTVPADNGHLLLVINIGNSAASLEIEGQPSPLHDLFTGAPHPSSFPLESFGVKLLHAKQQQ